MKIKRQKLYGDKTPLAPAFVRLCVEAYNAVIMFYYKVLMHLKPASALSSSVCNIFVLKEVFN